MSKKLFLSALAALVVVSMSNVCYAGECTNVQEAEVMKVEQTQKQFAYPMKKHFKGNHNFKAEMEAKKAEFEKRLNLTEEQKQQIEKNKQKDKEKMKPIMQEMHAKRAELMGIKTDITLAPHEKVEKMAPIEKDLIDLKLKANDLRKKNMEAFEKLLTKDQKVEFEKIKEEQMQKMAKRKHHFKKRGKKHFHKRYYPIEKPVMPEPEKVEK